MRKFLLPAFFLLSASVATLAAAPVIVTVAAQPRNLEYGQPVTLIARVQPSAARGSVSFYDGAVLLGTAQVVAASAEAIPPSSPFAGVATLRAIPISLGQMHITARYTGSAGQAVSAPVTVDVSGQYPSAAVVSSSGPADNPTLIGALTVLGPITATGNIQFSDRGNSRLLGSSALLPASLQQQFVPVPAPSLPSSPLAVAAADLNNDGIPDLVFAAASGLFVQLGSGNGLFQPLKKVFSPSDLSGNAYASMEGKQIAFGDFNADGNLDIAFLACTRSGCSLAVMLGNGDGSFQPAREFDPSSDLGGLAVGDFSGNGRLDIVVANYANSSVDLLEGNGDGSFQPPRVLARAGARSLAAADLSRTGRLDLAIADWDASTVQVLRNQGKGSFQPESPMATGVHPAEVVLADLRGSGRLDLLTLDGNQTVSALLANSDGGFEPATTLYAAPEPTLSALAAADVFSTGLPALLLADTASQSVQMLAANGDGSFQPPVSIPLANGPSALTVADLNHDGRPDLVVTGPSAVNIFLNQQQLRAALPHALASSAGLHTITADYSGDALCAPASSGPITLSTGLASPKLSATVLPSSKVSWGQAVQLRVTLSASSGAVAARSAMPHYSIDSGPAATLPLTTGSFTLSLPKLRVGKHSILVTTGQQPNGAVSQALSVTVDVTPAVPTITWAAPAAISYGSPLGAAQLNATASVDGTFSYSPAAGTVLTAGAQTLSVTFTPSDTADYSTATATVTLTVNPVTPVIAWPAPAFIAYGTALCAAQLNATSSVAGTFVYSPAAGAVLAAGNQTLSVTFTPKDPTDYSAATASVTLTVKPATPAITWAKPAAISYGTVLSATQLNASASVAGTLVYSPAAGAILTAGSQTLSVTFTPNDTADYTTATATVCLTVNPAKPTITWAKPAAISYGTALSATQLNASATIAGTFVYTPAAGTVPSAGSDTLSVTFTPADALDYTTATATVTQLVGPQVVTPPASLTVVLGKTASFTVSATSTSTLTYQWQSWTGTAWAAYTAGSGSTSKCLVTAATTAAMSGTQFRALVTDANGLSAASSAAMLTVSSTITTQPVGQAAPLGSTATFSVVAAGVPTLSYQWQSLSGSTWINVTAGSGANTATFTTWPVGIADNYTQFRVVVTDGNNLTVTSVQAKLTVTPIIVTPPVSQIAPDGSSVTFTVVGNGVPALNYRWKYWTGSAWANYTAGGGYETATMTVYKATIPLNGLQLEAEVIDADGFYVTSNPVTLSVAPAITTQPQHQTEPVKWSATFSVVAVGVPNLTYQWNYLNSSNVWVPFTKCSVCNAATLVTNKLALTDNGTELEVVVTDGNGLTVTSKMVVLTVIL